MGRLVLAVPASLAGLLLTLPVVVLGLPFWLMAAAVGLFARLTEPRVAAQGELTQFDPILGWKPKSNLDTHYLIRRDDIYPILTDASGWPGRQALSDSEMVVVGDSYAYGYGSRKGESFADIDPELKVKSVACPGYDLTQAVLLLRQLGDRLTGKLVVWLIYPENDLPDLLRPHLRGHRKPFVRRPARTGEWEIVSEHLGPAPWRLSGERNNMQTFAQLSAPGPLSDYCYSACDFLIGEAAELCRRVAARLAVLTIPNVNQLEPRGRHRLAALAGASEPFDAGYPDRRLGGICEKRGLPFIAGTNHFQPGDYKRFERFHLTPSGNRRLAGLLRGIRARESSTGRRSRSPGARDRFA